MFPTSNIAIATGITITTMFAIAIVIEIAIATKVSHLATKSVLVSHNRRDKGRPFVRLKKIVVMATQKTYMFIVIKLVTISPTHDARACTVIQYNLTQNTT